MFIEKKVGRLFIAGFLVSFALCGSDTGDAKTIFRKVCSGCHTYGHGIKVGPDLKGVTQRRQREWLQKFIQASSRVINSGDPTARELIAKFKPERMPDWTDLTPRQVSNIIQYFAEDGPLQKEPDERSATTATAAEIAAGRRLFHDNGAAFSYGGRACHTCHAIGEEESKDGSLGPNLTSAYVRYGDKAMTDFLKRPCYPRGPEYAEDRYLTPQESFDIKAYLAETTGVLARSVRKTGEPAPAGGAAENGTRSRTTK